MMQLKFHGLTNKAILGVGFGTNIFNFEQILKGSLGSQRCAAYANVSVREWPSRQHFARLPQIHRQNFPSNGGVNGVKSRLAANLHEIVSNQRYCGTIFAGFEN